MSGIEAWRALANRLIAKGDDIFDNSTVLQSEVGTRDPKVVALTLLARTVGNFEAALLLLDNGKVVEGRTLVRCCYENFFWAAALAKKGDEFVKQMELDDAASCKRRAKGLLEWAGQQDHELDFAKTLKAFVEDVEKKNPKAPLINQKTAAEHGTIKPAYIVYSELSNDAAHPSATSLSRHITLNGDGDDATFTVHAQSVPEEGEIDQTYEFGCSAMLGVCVAVNQVLGGTESGERLWTLEDTFRTLSNAGKAARDAVANRSRDP
jgi:hypothetical protein